MREIVLNPERTANAFVKVLVFRKISSAVNRIKRARDERAACTRRMAVMLMALAALSALPVAAYAQTTLWSETLTVGTRAIGSDTSYGWDDTGNHSDGTLSIDDQQFRYGYETFDLKAIHLNGGTLTLGFDADGDGDIAAESTRDKLELHIISTGSTKVLNFSAGSYSASGRSVIWNSTGLSWSSGNEVDLKIVENDTHPPALVGQDVTYGQLILQFSEDLNRDARPDRSAFAVTVDGVSRTVSSVSIYGAEGIVQLRLPLPVQAGEAVVVSYIRPATSPIQDFAGNAAASFAVTIPARVAGVAPAAPNKFAANAGNAHVTLKWTTPDNGGKTITGFEYRQKEGTGSFGTWMAIPDSGPYTTSYTVPNLVNGTDYTFEVRAENGAGKGASATASGTPSMSETIPPVLEQAYEADEVLRLLFDEVLDGNSVPDPSAFTVTLDEVSSDVIEVLVDGVNRMVRLQIASRLWDSASITIAYTPPATNPIKDLAGNPRHRVHDPRHQLQLLDHHPAGCPAQPHCGSRRRASNAEMVGAARQRHRVYRLRISAAGRNRFVRRLDGCSEQWVAHRELHRAGTHKRHGLHLRVAR